MTHDKVNVDKYNREAEEESARGTFRAAPDDERVGQILQKTYQCNLWRDHVVSDCYRVAYAFSWNGGQ